MELGLGFSRSAGVSLPRGVRLASLPIRWRDKRTENKFLSWFEPNRHHKRRVVGFTLFPILSAFSWFEPRTILHFPPPLLSAFPLQLYLPKIGRAFRGTEELSVVITTNILSSYLFLCIMEIMPPTCLVSTVAIIFFSNHFHLSFIHLPINISAV